MRSRSGSDLVGLFFLACLVIGDDGKQFSRFERKAGDSGWYGERVVHLEAAFVVYERVVIGKDLGKSAVQTGVVVFRSHYWAFKKEQEIGFRGIDAARILGHVVVNDSVTIPRFEHVLGCRGIGSAKHRLFASR